MTCLIETLEDWFSADLSVCVTGALLVYHKKGNKRARVAPDVFVVPGVGKHTRRNYLLWEEGRGLDCVIEVTSRRTRHRDTVWKRNLYLTKLGVQEYFLFDPEEDYLMPSLQGFHRMNDEFHPIKPVDGRLPSQVLGLHLARDGEDLRFYRPMKGHWLLTPLEAAQAQLEAERERAEAERARADAAEVAIQRMREELDRLRRALGDRSEEL
jgi:Uma2 family endonuclease